MSTRDMVEMVDASLITCLVQHGSADVIVEAARNAGAQGAIIYKGKGTGVRERLGLLGVTIEAEKDVIDVIVANDQVDHIFERMYLAGQLDTPGMGIIYVTRLEKVATYVPENIMEALEQKKQADASRGK